MPGLAAESREAGYDVSGLAMYGNDLDVVLQVISKFIGIFRISYEILHQSGEQLPRFYAGTEVVHQRACGDEDEVCCAAG
jgi:hypothetical protein